MKKIFTLLLLSAALWVCGYATEVKWNFSTWTAGDITEETTVDGLTVYAGSATDKHQVTIDGNNKTVDGVKYTQRLKFGGASNWTDPYRVLSFEVDGPTTVSVLMTSSSSNASGRNLEVYSGALDSRTLVGQAEATSSTEVKSFTYTGTEAATIWIGVNNGINIYYIEAKPYSSTGEPEDPQDPEDPEDPTPAEICGQIIQFGDFTIDGNTATLPNGLTMAQTKSDGSTPNISGGQNFTFDGATYKGFKVSNGATMTVTMPKNFIANKVTLICYQNKDSGKTASNCYWTINGENKTSDQITANRITSETGWAPNVFTYDLGGLSEFTFKTNGSECVTLLAIEYEQVATISAGGLTTFCPINGNVAIPEGVTAYTVEVAANGESAVLTQVEGGVLPQGEGVVLEGTAGTTYKFPASTEAAATIPASNKMVGVTADRAIPAGTYVLGVKSDNTCVFGKWTGTTTFPAGKAYLNYSSPSGAPLRIVKGDVTGIENVSVDLEGRELYNVNGQKVDAGYKGVVVMKGGKMIRK